MIDMRLMRCSRLLMLFDMRDGRRGVAADAEQAAS